MAPKDARFSRLSTDPRFLRPSKASQKVVLDDRFKSLLEDGNGSTDNQKRSKVDKYGKKVAKDKDSQALKSFYRLDDSKKAGPSGLDRARGEGLIESSDEEDENDNEVEDGEAAEKTDEEESDSDEDSDEDEDGAGVTVLGSKGAKKTLERRRREDSEVSIDLDEDLPVASTSALQDDIPGQDEEVPMLENSTKRIAVVNLDWDNVRAIDLYKIFDSVLSSSASSLVNGGLGLGSRKSKTKIAKGSVTSVKIYPSDFGKKRMEREEKEGPPVEIFGKSRKAATLAGSNKKKVKATKQEDDDFTDSDEENQEEYDEVALRRYQLERLRYYYAVVEFDTVSASQHAYDEIDGSEFEATANIFDLRFVPDEVTFDDQPTDVATANHAELQTYKPGEFVTDALRNSKVKLTWDQDDPERVKLVRSAHPSKDKKQKGKGKQEEEIDYTALLASDSEDDGTKRSRLRAAFGLGEEPAEGQEGDSDDDENDDGMEVTFGPALDGEEDADGLVDDADKEETSLEAYQRKERERRQRKKEKRLAEKKRASGKGRLVLDENDDSDPDEAYDANAFGEADGLDDSEGGGGDAFFEGGDADDQSDVGHSAAENGQNELSTTKKISKKAQKQLEREAKAQDAARLSLLVGGSDDEEGGGGAGDNNDDGHHFDMQAILRAEKNLSKPKKALKKGKDRKKYEEAKKLLEREKIRFEIDLKDDRFSKLHEDHEFALDPSNAKYVKTSNMERLLNESRKRRNDKEPLESEPSNHAKRQGDVQATSGTNGLTSLVESIKRKSQIKIDAESSGNKKQKMNKEHKKKKQRSA